MESFCEGTMGAAELISDHPVEMPKVDARARINDARVSEFAFVVRRITNSNLDDDDVILLATVLARAFDANAPITRDWVEAELRHAGRSNHKAAQLAGAILK